jgi:hypothetical protein
MSSAESRYSLSIMHRLLFESEGEKAKARRSETFGVQSARF